MPLHSEKSFNKVLSKKTYVYVVRPPFGCGTFIPPSKLNSGKLNPHYKSTICICKNQATDFIIRLDNNYLTPETLWAFLGTRQLNTKIIDWLNKEVRPLIGNK